MAQQILFKPDTGRKIRVHSADAPLWTKQGFKPFQGQALQYRGANVFARDIGGRGGLRLEIGGRAVDVFNPTEIQKVLGGQDINNLRIFTGNTSAGGGMRGLGSFQKILDLAAKDAQIRAQQQAEEQRVLQSNLAASKAAQTGFRKRRPGEDLTSYLKAKEAAQPGTVNFGTPQIQPETRAALAPNVSPQETSVSPQERVARSFSKVWNPEGQRFDVFDAAGNPVTFQQFKDLGLNVDFIPERKPTDVSVDVAGAMDGGVVTSGAKTAADVQAAADKAAPPSTRRATLTPEQQIQEDIDNLDAKIGRLDAQTQAGLTKIEGEAIAMAPLIGQQKLIEQRANAKKALLLTEKAIKEKQLGRIADAKQTELKNLELILGMIEGQTYDTLDPVTVATIDSIAQSSDFLTTDMIKGFVDRKAEEVRLAKEKAARAGLDPQDILSPSEAGRLGVPFGTTVGQATAMGIVPEFGGTEDGGGWEFTTSEEKKIAALGLERFSPAFQNTVLQTLTTDEQRDFIKEYNTAQAQATQTLDPEAFMRDFLDKRATGGINISAEDIAAALE